MLYIASLRRVHMYNIVHVLNVRYLADKFGYFLKLLHALYRYMEKERKEFDKVDICKEILNI